MSRADGLPVPAQLFASDQMAARLGDGEAAALPYLLFWAGVMFTSISNPWKDPFVIRAYLNLLSFVAANRPAIGDCTRGV